MKIYTFKKLITCGILYTYAVNMISKLNVYLHYTILEYYCFIVGHFFIFQTLNFYMILHLNINTVIISYNMSCTSVNSTVLIVYFKIVVI